MALPFDPVVAHRLQASFDFPQLDAHARSDRLPPEDVAAAIPAVRAVMREPKEVERLRLAEAPSVSVCDREPTELDEPRLIRMKCEPEACEPCLEIDKELLRLMPMLEADNGVIRITNDNHVAGGVTLPPLLDPEIIDVMEVDVRQQRADYSPNAKDNFEFELKICGWRGDAVLDLRRKR